MQHSGELNMSLTSILDVKMKCPMCGWKGTIRDTIPDVDGDGSMGCPVEDCGTIVEAA